MLNFLKKLYCYYIAHLFLRSKSDEDLNDKMDKIIDSHMEDSINGDGDLKNAISYAISYRKYERNLIPCMPVMDNLAISKVVFKSLFA